MKIFIASPVYDSPEPETVSSIEMLRDVLQSRGDIVPPWHWVRGGLVYESRNLICREFLAGRSEVLVQVDTDHQFKPGDLIPAIDFVGSGKADVVGFAHPIKQHDFKGPLGNLVSPRLLPERPIQRVAYGGHTFLAVGSVGGGVFITSRLCIEAMHDGGAAVFTGRAGAGEDSLFCAAWRERGGKVYCALEPSIGHIGRHIYRGSLVTELARVEAFDRVRAEKPLSRLVPPKEET